MGLGSWIPLYPVDIGELAAASAAEPKISEKLIWKISLSSASVNCGVDLDDAAADTADGILATRFDTDGEAMTINSTRCRFCRRFVRNLGVWDGIATSPFAIWGVPSQI